MKKAAQLEWEDLQEIASMKGIACMMHVPQAAPKPMREVESVGTSKSSSFEPEFDHEPDEEAMPASTATDAGSIPVHSSDIATKQCQHSH